MEILELYKSALRSGKRMVLATVVEVRGSAYRRPGARLLYVEGGGKAGSISAGCLERDIIARGAEIFDLPHGLLLEYDSHDFFGLNYGCDGVIHVLVQPLDCKNISYPLAFQIAREQNQTLGLATVVQSADTTRLGAQILFDDHKILATSLPGTVDDSYELFSTFESTSIHSNIQSQSKYFAYCDTTLFIEKIQPPLRLAIFGAGEDAEPLLAAARLIGLEPHIIDASRAHLDRFKGKELVHLFDGQGTAPSIIRGSVERTAIVIMSHNFDLDKSYLSTALATDCPYIGIVGSRKRTIKILDELGQTESAARIRFPIGLDIGAETAEEIALSICGEILSFFRKTTGRPLSSVDGPVHWRPAQDPIEQVLQIEIHSRVRTSSEQRTLTSCTISNTEA